MQLSAPEPDVRVQRINILLINKNSVDTYAFFGSLKQKYFAWSACWTQAEQASVNCMRCRVFFLVFSLFFPYVLLQIQTRALSSSSNVTQISQIFTIFRKYLIIFIDSTRFREIPIKIGTKIDEFLWNFGKFSKFGKTKLANCLEIFKQKIELRERCKGVHFVDLGESFPTHILLQNLASIQPRTSPSKLDS